MNDVTSSPEVINALSNQLMDPVAVLCADEILHLLQLLLQFFDACVPDSRSDPVLQDLLHRVLYVLQVPSDLAYRVIPQLEARVTLDAPGEDTSITASTLITVPTGCSLPAFARSSHSVTLGHLRAQWMAVTF